MIKDKGIFIKNIYYMLSYAFQSLRQKQYEEIAAEEFEAVSDLFAAILSKGISQQLKQGLYREYVTRREDAFVMRGKVSVPGTIKNRLARKRELFCEYDAFSVDNLSNRILKTTAAALARDRSVQAKYRAKLRQEGLFFKEVSAIAPSEIRWDRLRRQRCGKNYEMLMNVCYFVLDGMLMTTDRGKYQMAHFSDWHMHRLYEKFVLEYYKRHHGSLSEVKAARVKWDLSPGTEERAIRFLPAMQTDIFLRQGEEALIIDTKYYGRILREQYGKETFHSLNLFQIFAYVKNQDVKRTGKVSGMLLYAKTEEEAVPDASFVMGGNRISVRTLDLNQEFRLSAAQLDRIVEEHFTHPRS